MTEQSEKEGGAAQEQNKSHGFLLDFLQSNTTAALTLLYVYVSAIGMLYSYFLYRDFGISIFDHSEIADFLLAAFRNPGALVSAIALASIAALIAHWSDRRLKETRQRLRQYFSRAEDREVLDREDIERGLRWRRRITATIVGAIIIASLFVVASLALPAYFATRAASSIKQGETPTVDVRYRSFSGSSGQILEPDLRLIGATQRAVFFYDDNKRTIVIPQTQVVSIEVPE
jgi:hypothetical protein